MTADSGIPLSDVQSWMQQMILHPDGSGERSSQSRRLEAIVQPSKRLSAEQHLGIYQRSYVARLRDCMSNQFSALEFALGKELFQRFADEYLMQHPSHSYTLTDLGLSFAAFLEQTRPDKDHQVREDWPDFMIELVQFEFNINTIFDEHANEDYRLAEKTVADAELKLVPVFYLFEYQFPISWYYKTFRAGGAPELPLPEASCCAIVRNNYRLNICDLRKWQFQFLRCLKAEQSVSGAKRLLRTQTGMDTEKLEALWKAVRNDWIAAGFFCV